MANPKISIIVPCYNHGKYIDEALGSIDLIEDKNLYEVIIVDDGSKDDYTKEKLNELKQTGRYTILTQPNGGVSAARNNGISAAKADIILPVDADNKIHPEYVYKGLAVLEANPDIDIVYSNGQYFGEQTGIKYQRDFNLQALMLDNFVDTCAVFRKKVWEEVGGFDEQMRSGIEDWEYWMHAAFKGFKFYRIDEVLFEYRILSDSRNHMVFGDKTKANNMMSHMAEKHAQYYGPQIVDETLIKRYKHSPLGFIFKLFLKIYFPKRYDKLVQQGKFRKYIV